MDCKKVAKRRFPALLAFATVFCLVLCIQYSFADEAETAPYIQDLSVIDEYNADYGYASASSVGSTLTLSQKGGSIKVSGIAWWDDGSYAVSPSQVTYSIIGATGIANVSTSGVVTAIADGSTMLRVSVVSDTLDGLPINLDIPVVVQGQAERYVESICIIDADGSELLSYPLEGEKEKLSAQFYAMVTVCDPSSGSHTVYDTRSGLLSQQASDLSDLSWYASDSQLATLSDSGQFAPREYGTVSVFAMSRGGLGGATVTSPGVTVTTNNPDGVDESHPQYSLTVTVCYEADPEYTEEIVYSQGDLEALGTFSASYTLAADTPIQSRGYGVYLRNVVSDAAGLDIMQDMAAVRSVSFSGYDGANTTMSAESLFATRYYYPNYDAGGSTAGALAVEPMLAFSSNWKKASDGALTSDDMTNATQFRLLIGSNKSGQSMTGYSIKWINAMTITLVGAPPVEEDGPQEEKPIEDPSGGAGGGDQGDGSGGEQGSSAESGSSGDMAVGEGSDALESSDGETGEGSGGGERSIYQMMNALQSDVDIEYPENPFSPFVLPFGLGTVAAGGVESFLWFRRQKAPLGDKKEKER